MSANIEERIELDFLRPPLSFTFSDVGLKTGIRAFFSRVEGHRPYIRVGGRRITFDRQRPPVFHREEGGSWIRRAEVHRVTPKSGAPSFHVLRSLREDVDSALVYVNTRCVNTASDHIHTWCGLSDERGVLSAEGENYLLSLREGESVIVFFCERASKLTFSDGELTEETLTSEEDAFERARAMAFDFLPLIQSLPEPVRSLVNSLCEKLDIETAEEPG